MIWGEKSENLYIHVHGKMSSKEYAEDFAKIANSKGIQTLSFDLPEHGERKDNDYRCDIWNGMRDLSAIVLEGKLAELGIKVKTNHKITEMTGKSVSCEFEGKSIKYEADSVICALGLKSSNGIVEELRVNCKGLDIIPVGDVNKPRKIMQATHEGFHAARRI
jgi:hypothetical protein